MADVNVVQRYSKPLNLMHIHKSPNNQLRYLLGHICILEKDCRRYTALILIGFSRISFKMNVLCHSITHIISFILYYELLVYKGIRRPSIRQHFQTTSPQKPRSRFFSYFTYSIYRSGERIIVFWFRSDKNSGCYGNL